jgi:hypothetical protein
MRGGLVVAQMLPVQKIGRKSFRKSKAWGRPVKTLTVAPTEGRQRFSITLP